MESAKRLPRVLRFQTESADTIWVEEERKGRPMRALHGVGDGNRGQWEASTDPTGRFAYSLDARLTSKRSATARLAPPCSRAATMRCRRSGEQGFMPGSVGRVNQKTKGDIYTP